MTKDDFTVIYEKYADSVYRLALFLVGQREDAEDIVQQTFLKFYHNDPAFDEEAQRKAWLFKVTRNASYDLLKCADKRKRFTGDSTLLMENMQQEVYGNPEENSGDDNSILKNVSEKYRVVLYLFYYEEYSTREIAEILGISETAVRSRLTRGRKKLKMDLQKSR